jgi:hypothetical protein
MRNQITLLCLMMCVACGQVRDPKYAGPPLASLSGSLTGTGLSTNDEVRLAVIWFRFEGPGERSTPPTVVATDLAFTGTFPIHYQLDLYAPPPAEIISEQFDWQKLTTFHLATGVLVAYVDRNGNHQLDPIEPNGVAIDTVVGSSAPDASDWLGKGTWLLYSDADTELYGTIPQGFSLSQNGVNVSRATPISIELTSEASLNLFLCQQLFRYPQVLALPGTACAVAPPNRQLWVLGSLRLGRLDRPDSFYVGDGIHDFSDATVVIDNVSWLYSPERSGFVAPSPSTAGVHSYTVTANGLPSVSGEVTVPGAMTLTQPVANARLDPSAQTVVSWVAVRDADNYIVTVRDNATPFPGWGKKPVYRRLIGVTRLTLPVLPTLPDALLTVSAIKYGTGVNNVSVVGYSEVSIPCSSCRDPRSGHQRAHASLLWLGEVALEQRLNSAACLVAAGLGLDGGARQSKRLEAGLPSCALVVERPEPCGGLRAHASGARRQSCLARRPRGVEGGGLGHRRLQLRGLFKQHPLFRRALRVERRQRCCARLVSHIGAPRQRLPFERQRVGSLFVFKERASHAFTQLRDPQVVHRHQPLRRGRGRQAVNRREVVGVAVERAQHRRRGGG